MELYTAALAAGGQIYWSCFQQNNVESWDGTNWTEVAEHKYRTRAGMEPELQELKQLVCLWWFNDGGRYKLAVTPNLGMVQRGQKLADLNTAGDI